MAAATTIVVTAVMVVIGLTIYGLITNVYPHEKPYFNESLCTTCVNGSTSGTATTYAFNNIPIFNDSSLVCHNDSLAVMTNGVTDITTCLGYNVIDNSLLNITNSSNDASCQISNVVCTYTHDDSNANEEAFYRTNTSVTFAGFDLLSIAVIILAAIAILAIILFLRGTGG